MKITHVKIRNYRNLRNIDIGLSLKAITLPFLTDDNTHISKKLSWTDINNETKKCYYKKIRYLDMKEVDSGSNVVIFPLENNSYIKDYRVIDDSTVVSPLQIYLDCMQIKGRGEEIADFMDLEDEESIEMIKRDAYEQVQALLKLI